MDPQKCLSGSYQWRELWGFQKLKAAAGDVWCCPVKATGKPDYVWAVWGNLAKMMTTFRPLKLGEAVFVLSKVQAGVGPKHGEHGDHGEQLFFFLRLYLIYSTHSPCDWCVPNFNFLGSSKKWHNDIDPCENHRITSNMEHFNVISPTQCDFKRFQWSLRRHGRGRAVSVQMPAPGRKQPFSGWHPWLTNYIPSKK